MTVDPSFLRPVYEHDGPFASVLLETDRPAEDARHAVELRWRGLRERLASLGADDGTLSALDAAIGEPSGLGGERSQLVVATGGGVVLDQTYRVHQPSDLARWERLPYVLPLVRAAGDEVPCLVVEVDSAGADIEVRGSASTQVEVTGDDHPLHKPRGGGWSHRRIQQRVEDTVRHNAKLVAERVDELVRETGVDLVVVLGEPQARPDLTAQLSGDTRDLVVELDSGSRHADGQDVDALVRDVVGARARARTTSLVATYQEELARRRRGVAGLDRTVDALRKAQADTVLVEDGDGSAEASLWVGTDPLALARRPETLELLGVEVKHRVPATSALVRAAAASGAGVAVVESAATGHRDGVGATLRYAPEGSP